MIDRLLALGQQDESLRAFITDKFEERTVPARTVLLREGEVSTHLYCVKKGCLRLWVNKDGKDITVQFFFEGQGVASIESLLTGQPSLFTLETIEPATLTVFTKETFEELMARFPAFREGFNDLLFQRFRHYAGLFLSRIRDTPMERYEDLIRNHPEILRRIPQHYIASYLGITPISLSRIRNRR